MAYCEDDASDDFADLYDRGDERDDVGDDVIKINQPKDRTKLEHHYVCSKMREGKLNNRATKSDSLVDELLGVPVKPSSKMRSLKNQRTHILRAHRARMGSMKGRRRRGKRLEYDKELDVAWWKSLKASDVARANNMAKSTVPSVHLAVAETSMELMMRAIKTWLSVCEKDPPLAAFTSRRYDSAKARMATTVHMPVVGKLPTHIARQCQNMIICRREVTLVWPERSVELVFPCLPVPSDSTTAGSLLASVDLHPQARPIEELASSIIRHAGLKAVLDCGDGAYSNRKYDACMTEQAFEPGAEKPLGEGDPPSKGIPRELLPCGNHANHLTDTCLEAYLVGRGRKSCMSKLTSFCNLLRGANFSSGSSP